MTLADLFRERVAITQYLSPQFKGEEPKELKIVKPIDEAVAKFLAASEQLDKCLAEFDGDECSCGEYFAAWQDQMAELRKALK